MTRRQKIVLEVCVDSVASALAAQDGGADRVELCANLNEDGTTPSAGLIEVTRQNLSIGLHVLIRPRSGNFCYSEFEFETMKKDIAVARALGADGVVIGLLNANGAIAFEWTRQLVVLARPLSVTFHRAFDVVAEPLKMLEALVALGIERVLTSGQAQTALAGLSLLTQLAEQAAGRIRLMPASGINAQNIQQILAATGVNEIHVGSAVTAITNDSATQLFAAARRLVDRQKVLTLRQCLN